MTRLLRRMKRAEMTFWDVAMLSPWERRELTESWSCLVLLLMTVQVEDGVGEVCVGSPLILKPMSVQSTMPVRRTVVICPLSRIARCVSSACALGWAR